MSEISDGTRETRMDAVWKALRDHPELTRMRRRCSAHEFRTLFAEFQRLAVAPVEAERDTYAGRLAVLRLERDEARADLERVRRELQVCQGKPMPDLRR